MKLYSVAELFAFGKAVIRSTIGGVGTEPGTDHDLTLHAATRLLFGGQVAAAHLYQQLLPATADASGRAQMQELYGIVTEREASKARGLAIVLAADGVSPLTLPAGTTLSFPAEAFVDGAERTYVTLEDVESPGHLGAAPVQLSTGSGIHKLRPGGLQGAFRFAARDVVRVLADGGATSWLVVASARNLEDHSLDLAAPVFGAVAGRPLETVERYTSGAVVAVECVEAGAAGNVPPARAKQGGLAGEPLVMLLGAGGGGDAVGATDVNSARMVRLIEDTIACPPSFGNDQHWREIALSCPDVLLDDVVVYRHVRGPGTIDLVCIGPSGGARAPSYPQTSLAYVPWGNNQRFIGDVQAQRVEAWVRTQTSYFDDIRARSVAWDYRGNAFAELGSDAYFASVCRIDIDITPALGYGPDAGVAYDAIPFARDAARLYPARAGERVPDGLDAGHRVWAAVGLSTSNGRHAFATVVTEVLSVANDRSFVTIQRVSDLLPSSASLVVPGTNSPELVVLRWGTAGPVTQGVVDAVSNYFDQLGPGSFLLAPKGPGYVQRFWGDELATPEPGVELTRWPPEGRRWASGVRGSELRAAILRVPGVEAVVLGRLSDGLVDYDPEPLKTLALNGVLPRYRKEG